MKKLMYGLNCELVSVKDDLPKTHGWYYCILPNGNSVTAYFGRSGKWSVVSPTHWFRKRPDTVTLDRSEIEALKRDAIDRFGDWKLSRQIKFEQGKYPDWDRLSYSQMIDRFFSEIENNTEL